MTLTNELLCSTDSEKTVLTGVTVNIPAQAKIGICGRSGSGKSTFISTMLGLVKAYDGEVTIDGIDIGPHSCRLRDRVGAVTQHAAWLPGTSARFNLDPEWRRSDGELINHLQELGLWELIESKGGLDSRLEDMALSQGQQQVLSVARALVKRAKIVVFDEPTSRYVLESLFPLKMSFLC